MKNLLILFISALIFSCSEKYQDTVNVAGDYQIIPKPEYLKAANGRFLLAPDTKIISDSVLLGEAAYLKESIENSSGRKIQIGSTEAKRNVIILEVDSKIEHKEGYQLSVTNKRVLISASTNQGVFYGIQSLLQLLPIDDKSDTIPTKDVTIPAVQIEDQPRYGYRGMHLDVGRHFFGVEYVKKYLDLIAMHKMNTFHWHLTEDQGWRIEIKKYPKLTEIGAYRKGTAIGLAGSRNAPYTYDTIPYGGFYTQEQIKEVIAYAAERHITVIPEIELPGHSLAALAAYPELGNGTGPYEVAKRWGIFTQIYAPSEETFQFLEDVLTEVMALFPSKYIHIGGDEVIKKEWEESAYAQSLIKKEGLKDEHELQSYFVQRIEKFLNANGRDMIGWDEILEGGLAPNATVMSWRGVEGGIAAAQQHHHVIMTPGTHCYFDYYQEAEENRIEEPITGSKRHTTVEKVYSYEPTPSELSQEEGSYILGVQGNVWTEYMPTWEQVEYKVLPRMTALSEVGWSSPENKNWDDFRWRLQQMAKRYDTFGYNYAKYVIDDK
ncbi:beta-N-acetylhexosaminidase [Lutimonas sp.]|uniref:beta-N-acetylhexosaminidase n=1 Tax=Lutimonas sp. TaxID=1872403 RepID=UPI003D9AFCDA